MTATTSIQNWKISSHVIFIAVTPSLLLIGGKEAYRPRKITGEPPTGVLVVPLIA